MSRTQPSHGPFFHKVSVLTRSYFLLFILAVNLSVMFQRWRHLPQRWIYMTQEAAMRFHLTRWPHLHGHGKPGRENKVDLRPLTLNPTSPALTIKSVREAGCLKEVCASLTLLTAVQISLLISFHYFIHLCSLNGGLYTLLHFKTKSIFVTLNNIYKNTFFF